ncbi:nodulation protein NolB [Bradyrhizobium sp. sGM-13]|uniref:nodulation protein NolB n=1 Tax=Bradyrhizobium sp. sGM-13 TaxID=2831781 RepID=UPI001BCB22EC|nr:nodulation protein NolB [Bradyrhizobium sp. sGM-13]
MSFDPLAAINGAVSTTAPLSGSAAPAGDAAGAFSRVVANASSEVSNTATPHASARAQESRHDATRVAAVREYPLTSLPRNPQDGLGHHVLDRLETLYRGDQRLRTANAHSATDASPVALAGAGLPRGPAAAPLNGAIRPDDAFNVMLRNFEQVYQQSIQVGLMTKGTGAFTTSMNKLMSSA